MSQMADMWLQRENRSKSDQSMRGECALGDGEKPTNNAIF